MTIKYSKFPSNLINIWKISFYEISFTFPYVSGFRPVRVAQKNKPSTMLSSNVQSIDLATGLHGTYPRSSAAKHWNVTSRSNDEEKGLHNFGFTQTVHGDWLCSETSVQNRLCNSAVKRWDECSSYQVSNFSSFRSVIHTALCYANRYPVFLQKKRNVLQVIYV